MQTMHHHLIIISNLIILILTLSTTPLARCSTEEMVFTKSFLFEQLLNYRKTSGRGMITTPQPSLSVLINKTLYKDLPFPGADLIEVPPEGQKEVAQLDITQIAYDIYRFACAGDHGTFEWGVLEKSQNPTLYLDGWTRQNFLKGFLVPICMCKGKQAEDKKVISLVNIKSFLPLIDMGYSHLSTVMLETCEDTSADKLYWPAECNLCNKMKTKTCLLSTGKEQNVTCECYYGFDPGSHCNNMIDACSIAVSAHDKKTGRDMCGVSPSTDNKCTTDGDSYMCTCFMPHLENLTDTAFPNCRGLRPYESRFTQCEKTLCGMGSCVGRLNASLGVCECQSGYSGLNCMTVGSILDAWSTWSDCTPDCANTGTQTRKRICHSSDEDPRFCEGIRRQHRRCQPTDCFVTDILPVFIKQLSDPMPTNLYLWAGATGLGVFWVVYLTGLLISLGGSYQDWKLTAVNQSGRLTCALDDICDDLIHKDTGETQYIFETNLYVPPAIVDHVMGVRRLRKLKLQKAAREEREKVKKGAEVDAELAELKNVSKWERGKAFFTSLFKRSKKNKGGQDDDEDDGVDGVEQKGANVAGENKVKDATPPPTSKS